MSCMGFWKVEICRVVELIKIFAFNESLKFKKVQNARIFTVLSKIISDFYESKLIR